MQSTPVENSGHAHVPDDVLALLPRADVVRALLAEYGVELSRQEEAHDLGLARLTIADTNKAAAKLTATKVVDSEQFRHLYERPTDPLDQVIWALRGLSAARYSGWVPTLGKNRVLNDRLGGVGVIIHGDGVPQPTDWRPSPRLGGRGTHVRIGLLDTAVYDHPSFAGSVSARYSDLVDSDRSPTLAEGHATFMAGLMLQRAPGAHIEARRILDEQGTGDVWAASKELVALGRSGVDIVNMSFACYTSDGRPPMALLEAVARVPNDVVLVAAAGNHGADADAQRRGQPAWPAALDRVTAVGAAQRDESQTGAFRNATFSPVAPWVDVAVPGVDIDSTFVEQAVTERHSVEHFDGAARWSGTSMAAGQASGIIAAGTSRGTAAQDSLSDLLRTSRDHTSTFGHPFPLVR